jgi:SMI1 / KNR4 family (SUKH-1)
MPKIATDQMIKDLELKLKGWLPNDYKDRMKRNNGGMQITEDDEWEMASIRDNSSADGIRKTSNDVILCTDGALKWQFFPRNGIAIGDNGLGDVLFFHKNGSHIGPELYMYFHETGCSIKVANSISEYGTDE